MRFLMFIKHSERIRSQDVPKALMAAMETFVGEGFKTGKLKDTAGLRPAAEAIHVRSSGGKLTVTDGPFAESREVVGGFAMVETASKEEARDLARQFMELHRIHWPAFEGECEVRQVEEA